MGNALPPYLFGNMALSRHLLRAPRLLRQCQQRAVITQQRCNASEEAVARTGDVEMEFTFASPSDVYYKATHVQQVDVVGLSGAFGVLKFHVPTIAALMPGVVSVKEMDGNIKKFFVSSGALTVNNDSTVSLLAEEAHPLERFDSQSVSANLSQAQGEVSGAKSDEERAEAQIKVDCLTSLQSALAQHG